MSLALFCFFVTFVLLSAGLFFWVDEACTEADWLHLSRLDREWRREQRAARLAALGL